MAKTKAGRNRTRRRVDRADALFLVYKMLGPERSLLRLREVCTGLGLAAGLSTLKQYSIDFRWQERLMEEAARDKAALEKQTAQQVEQMNTRHAQIAQGMMGLVVAGMAHHQNLIRTRQAATGSPNAMLNISVRDMAQLFRTAQQAERLARGQATSRVEVWIEVAQTVVKEFAMIFMSVNEIPDKAARKAEFVRLSDEMMRRYYTEQAREAADYRFVDN